MINDIDASRERWTNATADRPGYPNLVTAGHDTFFSWNPIARNMEEPNRIYRAFDRGAELELLRLAPAPTDHEGVAPGDETVHGDPQMAWLKQSLLASSASRRVVSSDIPLSIMTDSNAKEFGRDAFANGTDSVFSGETGFEEELIHLLTFIDDNDDDNVVFVVMDVHFAMPIRHAIDPNGDGDQLDFHELVGGPNNAIAVRPPPLDPTFNSQIPYSEVDLFNFQYVRLEPSSDGTTLLIADVRSEDGLVQPGSCSTSLPAIPYQLPSRPVPGEGAACRAFAAALLPLAP